MLSEEAKSGLCEKILLYLTGVNKNITESTLKRMIDIFDHSLEIEPVNDVELVPVILRDEIEKFLARGVDKSYECVKGINVIEQYCKHIMYSVRPYLLSTAPKREWDSGNGSTGKKWQLADVYKEGLRLVEPGKNLTQESAKALEALKENPISPVAFPEGYYYIAYVTRNNESHDAIKRHPYVANQVALCIIMTYLLIADKYSSAIESRYEYAKISKYIDLHEYLNAIVAEKSMRLEKYVPLSWKEYSRGKENVLLLPDRITGLPKQQLKVVGHAGSGKTFFLEKIELLLAQNYFNPDNVSHLIPVYLRLIDLIGTTSDSIEALFATKTGISIDAADEFMCNKNVLLLLDGYDEISEKSLKQRAAIKIDYLVHNNANIIVTDREINSRIPLSDGLECYIPQKLESVDIRHLIEMYAQKNEIKKDLLNKLDSTPEYFNSFDTPLKLVNLIEISDYNGAVLEDQSNLTGAYIQSLFDRESQKNKNPLTKPLQSLLAGLALEGEGPFSQAKISAIFTSWQTKLGYDCSADACFRLATQLGILISSEEENQYTFCNEEFFITFLVMAEKIGLMDLQ